MDERLTLMSLARNADFDVDSITLTQLPFDKWENGDFIVGRVIGLPGSYAPIELTNGRMARTARGDLILGALGIRHATLEVTGSWKHIGDDLKMRVLTGAGLLGKMISKAADCPAPIPLTYEGHAFVRGEKATMNGCAARLDPVPFKTKTVVLVGTSMKAGKTTVAQAVIRVLKRAGLRVAGSKLTGAGRYRDILAMSDAGADHVVDFVDAGLPSTVCPLDEYQDALGQLLTMISNCGADVAVAEVGASPLEPYNGAAAILGLGECMKCTILCASDPYAVVGVMEAFGMTPDLVSGVATNTMAGVELIDKLCGISAVNVLDSESVHVLAEVLAETLEIPDILVRDSTAPTVPLIPTF